MCTNCYEWSGSVGRQLCGNTFQSQSYKALTYKHVQLPEECKNLEIQRTNYCWISSDSPLLNFQQIFF